MNNKTDFSQEPCSRQRLQTDHFALGNPIHHAILIIDIYSYTHMRCSTKTAKKAYLQERLTCHVDDGGRAWCRPGERARRGRLLPSNTSRAASYRPAGRPGRCLLSSNSPPLPPEINSLPRRRRLRPTARCAVDLSATPPATRFGPAASPPIRSIPCGKGSKRMQALGTTATASILGSTKKATSGGASPDGAPATSCCRGRGEVCPRR